MQSRQSRGSLFWQRILITTVALVVFVLRLVFPMMQIDAVSLGLLVVAILPWLSSLIKSVELPGVGKIELQDVKAAVEKVEAPEASAEDQAASDAQSSYLAIAQQNPSLALVGLRIEIEKRLRALAEKAGVPKSRPLTQLARDLVDHGVLSSRSVGGLLDLIGLGNQAAHGVEVAEDAAISAVEYGPKILKTLDSKLAKI
jgi:hypothetical protein